MLGGNPRIQIIFSVVFTAGLANPIKSLLVVVPIWPNFHLWSWQYLKGSLEIHTWSYRPKTVNSLPLSMADTYKPIKSFRWLIWPWTLKITLNFIITLAHAFFEKLPTYGITQQQKNACLDSPNILNPPALSLLSPIFAQHWFNTPELSTNPLRAKSKNG